MNSLGLPYTVVRYKAQSLLRTLRSCIFSTVAEKANLRAKTRLGRSPINLLTECIHSPVLRRRDVKIGRDNTSPRNHTRGLQAFMMKSNLIKATFNLNPHLTSPLFGHFLQLPFTLHHTLSFDRCLLWHSTPVILTQSSLLSPQLPYLLSNPLYFPPYHRLDLLHPC